MSRLIAFAAIFATRAMLADAQLDAEWNEHPMEYANATSIVQQVPGYDYRKDFPGEPVTGWTLSYAVASRPENSSSFWAESAIIFRPPESLGEFDTNESWATCGMRFWLEVKSDDQKVDPLCEGVVSDACHKALLKAVKTGQLCFAKNVIPTECDKELANAENEDLGMHGKFASVGFRNHRKLGLSGLELYDALLRRIVVSVIGFTRNENEFREKEVKESPRIEGVLSCLRASNIKEGSRTLSGGRATGDKDEGKDEDKKEPGKNEGDSEKDGGQNQGENDRQDEEKGNKDEQEKDKPGAASTMRATLAGICILIAAQLLV